MKRDIIIMFTLIGLLGGMVATKSTYQEVIDLAEEALIKCYE